MMIPQRIEKKGIIAKFLEEGIKILLKKECKKISIIEVNILASSIQIIKGMIKKINVTAKNINYKDLLIDEIELEANNVKIIFKIHNRVLKFENDLTIKFKISLSESSLKKVLLSSKWNWIGNMISKKILNSDKLEDLQIKNDQLFIKAIKGKMIENKLEKVDINIENGNFFLENRVNNKSIKMPFEDKVLIENVHIKNNLIIISANSSINF
tara:strand:- start:799 stop:1434 length:636 start_codon:yes stop_codon:yes gene_type:complete